MSNITTGINTDNIKASVPPLIFPVSDDELIGQMRKLSQEYNRRVNSRKYEHKAEISSRDLKIFNQRNTIKDLKSDNEYYMKTIEFMERKMKNLHEQCKIWKNRAVDLGYK